MGELTQIRDLTIWKWTRQEWLVFATDNLTGIGKLAFDQFEAPPEDVGYFTARVALFELLSSGATPQMVIDTASAGGSERSSYTERIVSGIREAVQEAGLPDVFPITGSSEDNILSPITTLSVTAVGQVFQADFRPGTVRAGDEVWLVGIPKSAPHDPVLRSDKTSVSFRQLLDLLGMNAVREALPVGSRGAIYEAHEMAATAGLRFLHRPQIVPGNREGIATKSGGPATAVIVGGRLSLDPRWHTICSQIPCYHLGQLEDES